MSRILQTGMSAIFQGQTTVGDGLLSMDNKLRILLGMPLSNSTSDDSTKAAKPKTKFNNLMEQVMLLFLFVGCGVTGVVLYKRKTILDQINEQKRRGLSLASPNRQEVDYSETARLIRK